MRFVSTLAVAVLLLVPTVVFGETGDAFVDARVLAVHSAPFKALVAVKKSDLLYSFEVRDQASKVLESAELEYPSADKAPRFSGKELLSLAPVRKLLSDHKMRTVRAESVSSSSKAAGTILYLKDRVEVVVVTSIGRIKVAAFDASAQVEPYFYFDETAGVGMVSGHFTGGEQKGPSGFLHFLVLGTELTALPDSVLAALWLEAAGAELTRRSLEDGCKKLEQALKLKKSAQARYLGFFCQARSGRFEQALKQLEALRVWAGRSAEGKRLLARIEGSPLARESALQAMDINRSDKLWFKAAKGFEGTSVWVKIKDSNGNNLAVFKPTNGNTYHRGEVFTWQMAKLLGLSDLYPVTFLHTLDKSGCRKLVDALEKVKYKGMKERNKQALIKGCNDGRLEGAVKEWVHDFVFFQAIGKAGRLKKHSLYRGLQANGGHPPSDKTMTVRTASRLYKPDHCAKATYTGVMNVKRLAQDMSDLMIVDVLNANEDRFPGANIEFKSLGEAKEVKKCVFDFGESRLFSLDNGATFKGTRSNALADFTKRVKVTRFRRPTFERLEAIQAFIKGQAPAPGFLRKWGIESVEDLSRFLVLDKGDSHKRRKEPFKLFEKNLSNVLKHMKPWLKNKNAWFK